MSNKGKEIVGTPKDYKKMANVFLEARKNKRDMKRVTNNIRRFTEGEIHETDSRLLKLILLSNDPEYPGLYAIFRASKNPILYYYPNVNLKKTASFIQTKSPKEVFDKDSDKAEDRVLPLSIGSLFIPKVIKVEDFYKINMAKYKLEEFEHLLD